MVFVGDRLVSAEKGIDRNLLPNLAEIEFNYRSSEKDSRIKTHNHGESTAFSEARLSLEKASINDFANLFDFMVNTHNLQVLKSEAGYYDWLFAPIETHARVSYLFRNFARLRSWLGNLGLNKQEISNGFLLHRQYGRIDEDIVWSKNYFVFQTGEEYVSVYWYETSLQEF